ncbi:MAG: hypothetical protein ACOYL6_16870 [Bacteriovoracaceae bacterium]
MKNLFIGLLALFSISAFAGSYCHDYELKELSTGEVLRKFNSVHNKKIDENCEATLRASSGGLYCNGYDLKNLSTGEVLRRFNSVHNKKIDENCEATLKASI